MDAYLEVGSKRVFAAAVEWPGWCRSGRTADEALATLVAYGPRYRSALAERGDTFVPPSGPGEIVVTRSLEGDASTDFGVPGMELPDDGRPLEAPELDRLVGLLEACWAAFDRMVEASAGARLRTGPRGGGREVPKIVDHVEDAERAYLGQLGRARPPAGEGEDRAAARAAFRATIVEQLRRRAAGEMPEMGRRRSPFWSPRYFVRRAAWHVLDHTWEIEDRREALE